MYLKDDILDINYLNNHGRVYVIGERFLIISLLLIQIILLIKIKSLMSQILLDDNYIPYCLTFYDIKF